MLGAQWLAEQCAELERLGRMGEVPGASARARVIEATYQAVETALKAEVAKGQVQPADP